MGLYNKNLISRRRFQITRWEAGQILNMRLAWLDVFLLSWRSTSLIMLQSETTNQYVGSDVKVSMLKWKKRSYTVVLECNKGVSMKTLETRKMTIMLKHPFAWNLQVIELAVEIATKVRIDVQRDIACGSQLQDTAEEESVHHLVPKVCSNKAPLNNQIWENKRLTKLLHVASSNILIKSEGYLLFFYLIISYFSTIWKVPQK